MTFKFTAKRWHKVTAIVLGVLIGIVLLLSLFVNSYWSPILSSKKLADAVQQEFRPGDSLVLPLGYTGTWEMQGDYRELAITVQKGK